MKQILSTQWYQFHFHLWALLKLEHLEARFVILCGLNYLWALTPSDELEQQSLCGVPLNAGNVENDSAFWAERTFITTTTTVCRLSIAAAAAATAAPLQTGEQWKYY